MAVVAELADEALLPTQAAAEDVRAGKLDHLGQEGGQFPVNHLQESRRLHSPNFVFMSVHEISSFYVDFFQEILTLSVKFQLKTRNENLNEKLLPVICFSLLVVLIIWFLLKRS